VSQYFYFNKIVCVRCSNYNELFSNNGIYLLRTGEWNIFTQNIVVLISLLNLMNSVLSLNCL
jgi:hypothetical protein